MKRKEREDFKKKIDFFDKNALMHFVIFDKNHLSMYVKFN
jgi:hypothetical protein